MISLSTILIVVLILLLVGALPRWNYSRSWGNGPSSIIVAVLVVIIILALLGKI